MGEGGVRGSLSKGETGGYPQFGKKSYYAQKRKRSHQVGGNTHGNGGEWDCFLSGKNLLE